MPMKQKLVASIKRRLADEISPQNPVKFLQRIAPEDIVENTIATIYLYTRNHKGVRKRNVFMAEVISAIGHNIRNKFKLKRDSATAAKAGAFILFSFEEFRIVGLKLGQGPNGHATYIVDILNEDLISSLFESVRPGKIEKLPSLVPYKAWTSCVHETGARLIKTANEQALSITPETHPIVFECVNRSQATGWQINKDVYNIFTWALRNKTEAFAEIWEMQNPEAKQSKIRETKTIGDMAGRFVGKTFYHLYYYDFRGRKYPATAYLHEQGSDPAKGLLLRADKKAIGKAGFFWLLVSIANNWAGDAGRADGVKTDKVPLKERYTWALDNEEILLSYAESPKVNQGWMQADKPWQFIAACIELYKLRKWQASMTAIRRVDCFDDFSYESHIECYIDGTNNGSQHLSALTRDEITAPHVNLVPSELPGDLYKYIADDVWKRLDIITDDLTQDEIDESSELIDKLIKMKKEVYESGFAGDHRKQLLEKLQEFRVKNNDLIIRTAAVFWSRITDNKHKRKIVKRNVMTLPYGGTPYGLGQQQIDDARKHGIDLLIYLENKWSAFMGRVVFDTCKESLKRPMRLLSVFEAAGKQAENEGTFLKWNVPVTNFPVVQNYTEGKVKKIWVQYGPPVGSRTSTGYYQNTLQMNICFIEDVTPSKYKQSQGASPNAIHSLDAAHLMLTTAKCSFPITTIHDSYGCLLADMDQLFVNVRDAFVELYEADPLNSLMQQINGDISQVEIGTLDVGLIRDSEYAFC